MIMNSIYIYEGLCMQAEIHIWIHSATRGSCQERFTFRTRLMQSQNFGDGKQCMASSIVG